MSEKIGIVTLFGFSNYGNKLQNYATQEIFKAYGYDCYTIVSSEYSLKKKTKLWARAILNKDARTFSFWKFNKKNMKMYVVKGKKLLFPNSLADEFKYFVVGSDQVWNPLIRKNQRSNLFLQFARKEQRLTIAPSISVNEIPSDYTDTYREGLNGFDFISVREQKSAEVVKRITGKDATVIVDPTMALPTEKWIQLEKAIELPKQGYICVLFLGKVDEQRQAYLKDVANQLSLEIIDMNSKKWRATPPDEFLHIIHNAHLVCTDSFHCTVFSILFERPFVVFSREAVSTEDVNVNAEGRLTTLLNKFGLTERMSTNINSSELMSVDFSKARDCLEIERDKFYAFMDMQLGIKREGAL